MAATLGGIFSSAFSALTMGMSFDGMGHDTLASNKFVEGGLVLGHEASSVFCGAVAVTAALGCCSSWGLLPLVQRGLLPPWTFLWDRGFH